MIVVSRMMGHKSTRMVELVYGQLGLNSFQDAAETCAGYVTNFCANVPIPDEIENEAEKAKTPQTVSKRGFRVL